ncbi:urea ABC transporter ATP-binding subunit UrtE [Roseateles sp. BYS87W]|uniref:Urea ABC transporter ATP-binding subunit UrtE n=1 Tax=Pelomonas baiyunensis TaxID=3299026 RepID=A0ABW7H3R5_9BURK
MADDLLKVEDLHKHYGGSHILRGLSFELKAGEITVVMGRNGVGKTTLLKSLMGVVPVTSGRITLAGEAIDKLKTHQRVRAGLGYVPQGREIFGRLTVMENLQMGLASQPAGTPLPDELFQLFPVLNQMRSRRGGDLSGGQQQQLAIARALAPGPQVLLLDEPTEGIQPNVIQDIGRVIRHLAHNKGLCVVLVEQYYDFCEQLADQYLLMQRGEIVMRGRGPDMKADGVRERLAI